MATALLLVLTMQVQPQRDTRPARAQALASIVGVITSDEPEPRPLRRARVTVNGPALYAPRTVITGDDGAFAIRNLPAGRFTISAAKDGFVPMAYGAARTGRPGTIVTLEDRQSTSVTVRLPRGAVITGTVMDVDGLPAQGINVTVLARRFSAGAISDVSYVTAGAPSIAATDDRGVYRIYGVPAGEYIIAAQPVPGFGLPPGTTGSVVQMMSRGATAAGRMLLSQVFHPGVVEIGRASRVTVRAGEERTGIDVQLEYVPLATVSGTAVLPAGFGPARVTLWRTDELARPQTGPVTTADNTGRFQFPLVAPGQYHLTARGAAPGGTPANVQYASADVVVNGEDVDVPLAGEPPLSISGAVVFEGDRPSPSLPSQLSLNVGAFARPTNGGWPIPPLQVDGTRFRLDGIIPGVYRLSGNLQGIRSPIGPWWVKSIVIAGRDILDAPLELRSSADDAVVTFSDRASELSGTATSARGAPAADAYVVAFSTDRAMWFFNSRRIAGVRTDRDGRYTIRNLPPGEYRVAATTDLEPYEWFDPSVLERLLPTGLPLTISGAEKRTVDLPVR